MLDLLLGYQYAWVILYILSFFMTSISFWMVTAYRFEEDIFTKALQMRRKYTSTKRKDE